jgi:hypothetical protein
MATRPKKTPIKQPLQVSTIKLTPAEKEILHRLSQDASDNLGWTVTPSAVIRALIQHAGEQPQTWRAAAIYPPISREIDQGRVWGFQRPQKP